MAASYAAKKKSTIHRVYLYVPSDIINMTKLGKFRRTRTARCIFIAVVVLFGHMFVINNADWCVTEHVKQDSGDFLGKLIDVYVTGSDWGGNPRC